MNWHNWQLRKENLNKEASLRGEWWIVDGQAQFADGDVGDLNHEAAVIEDARSSILSTFDIHVDEIYDWEERRDNLSRSFINEELDESKKWDHESSDMDFLQIEFDNDPILFFWTYLCEPNGIDKSTWEMAEGIGDVRQLAMKHWGHKRMVGSIIETYTLTPSDLSSIVYGIGDAYGEDLNDSEENGQDITFTIEVDATRSLYEDVPMSVLERKSIAALSEYRRRY